MNEIIQKYNLKWQSYFNAKRLEFLYELPAEVIDFMEKLVIQEASTWHEELEYYSRDTDSYEVRKLQIWEVKIIYNEACYSLRSLEYLSIYNGSSQSNWGFDLEHENSEDIAGDEFSDVFDLDPEQLDIINKFFSGFSFETLCFECEHERARQKALVLQNNPQIRRIYSEQSDVYIEFENGMKAKLYEE